MAAKDRCNQDPYICGWKTLFIANWNEHYISTRNSV